MFGNTGYKTHAHHIVMRKGLGPEGQRAAEESQQILQNHRIDPLESRENLIWAPNWGHPDQYAVDVLAELREAVKMGGKPEAIKNRLTETLKKLGREYIDGRWRPQG